MGKNLSNFIPYDITTYMNDGLGMKLVNLMYFFLFSLILLSFSLIFMNMQIR